MQLKFKRRKTLISAKLPTKYVIIIIIIYALGSVHEKIGF